MALYNNGYPMGYQQPYQQNYQQGIQIQQPAQIQQGGFVSVPSEDAARRYPVAPGNSVTFKDETQPYVYEKTMGFSQFESPVFKKFRLIEEKEEMPAPEEKAEPASDLRAAIDGLTEKVDAMRQTINMFINKDLDHEQSD